MQEPYEELEEVVKDPRSPEQIEKARKESLEQCRRINEAQMKDPSALIKWLKDSEQIADDDEEPEDFIERTGNTFEKENEYRKENGLPLFKNKEEYLKRLRDENNEKE